MPTGGRGGSAAVVLVALLEARTGQRMADHRSWRLDTALMPLLRERGLDTLDQLVGQLLAGHDRQLADRIVDALVNNETSFFREAAVFDQLVDVVAAAGGGARPRIWCAGCSTGQEPLSIAMLAAERGLPLPEIVATDVSDGAITRARAGRFSQFEVQRGLPIRRLMRWFEEADGEWAVSTELLRAIAWRRLNLVDDRPPPGRFDLVLCRNVLLYLSPERKAACFRQFARVLRPGGTLVLGAGETALGQSETFSPSTLHRGFYVRND